MFFLVFKERNMNKILRIFLFCFLCILLVYGGGRLYFFLTGGFTLENISSDFPFQRQWEVRPLLSKEEEELEKALGQSYRYLGKGCQSYVFLSEDGKYVIKFFKYQRYRLQMWLEYFPSLPAISKYREEKKSLKWNKLDGFVRSWKVAFEDLKEETGLVYVHLNKTDCLKKKLVFFDKMNRGHQIELDQMEFCVQRRAQLLCDVLLEHKEKGDVVSVANLVRDVVGLILSEYGRGLGDQDHALMQNTGVVEGKPVHIDVGQFVKSEEFKNPLVFHQELFTKMYKFREWLKENYSELGVVMDEELRLVIGDEYAYMQPKFRKK
jgi:hypothetical protein